MREVQWDGLVKSHDRRIGLGPDAGGNDQELRSGVR